MTGLLSEDEAWFCTFECSAVGLASSFLLSVALVFVIFSLNLLSLLNFVMLKWS